MERIKFWFHSALSHHDGLGDTIIDETGCERNTCSVCGRPVVRDLKGNWFLGETSLPLLVSIFSSFSRRM